MRAGALIAYLIMILIIPARAEAHPMSTTAILLEPGAHVVTGSVQLPVDRLEVALGEKLTDLTTIKIESVRGYVMSRTAATGDAGPWTVAMTGGHVAKVDDVDHLVFDLTLTPPDGVVGDFRLDYDAILDKIVSHQVFVTEKGATIGVLDWRTHVISVPVAGATTQNGFLASVRLGVRHIGEGADHLLFLIMLLLPAPLVVRGRRVRGRRWTRGGDLRRNGVRVVHVVTAFAIGHSITLALGALGWISVPTRVVESLIALSVLVSGVHAIRPLVRGGEAWIAAGFGLMHGLAFAALIGDLGLDRGSLVADLFGFNLGIELTQLLVVALLMPSLLVLSRTRFYPAVRVTLAGAGIVLAAAWLAERTTLIGSNPLNAVTDALVAHPFVVAGTLAAAAAIAWAGRSAMEGSLPGVTTPTGR